MADSNSQKMAAIGAKQDIEIELATRPALRLWQGREKTQKRHGILGLPGFCKIVRGIEQAVREDDPYADYHYHRIEQAIDDLTFDLDSELKDIQSFIDENIPPAMRLPDIGSKNPVVVPIRFASRLGFQLVYQLLKVDQIVLKVLLANHIGLLPNKEKFETLARVEKRVRSVLHMVFSYRHTGVTRDDMAANNQKAQKAKELMGDLEVGYLEGTTRSDNAPPLPMKRLQTMGKALEKGKAENKSKAAAKEANSSSEYELGAELDRVLKQADEEMTRSAKKKVATA
ncbi:TIGR03761 family integrating conjugative element protein [Dasania sp. GY-19]|uniref:TIGR03761 family integrating conjugative element protein n=1 Tax=Dasania phycosphaerae TaxID=2950436 RepID=A0A9J6RQV6_9GAMM|nr:TIGR03761 family integrating conjugative element protein [Dasania phycosphaerae]MCZ0866544.1 TIGR03761 family integrating conjugative element protein [Dasania phycosphaerae]